MEPRSSDETKMPAGCRTAWSGRTWTTRPRHLDWQEGRGTGDGDGDGDGDGVAEPPGPASSFLVRLEQQTSDTGRVALEKLSEGFGSPFAPRAAAPACTDGAAVTRGLFALPRAVYPRLCGCRVSLPTTQSHLRQPGNFPLVVVMGHMRATPARSGPVPSTHDAPEPRRSTFRSRSKVQGPWIYITEYSTRYSAW